MKGHFMNNKLVIIGLSLFVGLGVGYILNGALKDRPSPEDRTPRQGINQIGQNNRDDQPVNQKSQLNKGNCLADDCLLVENLEYPADELPAEVENALIEAINDEYKALATYDAVINKFGASRPFSMIKGAEEQHVASLKAIFDKYGVDYPENTYLGSIPAPNTLQEACQTGVEAEIANAALYKDELLPAVSEYEDIVAVFTNLMNASEQKHLPAFEKCD